MTDCTKSIMELVNMLSECRCSVQRIANRSGVLSEPRKELLDSVEFDWTGADALS